MSHPQKLPDKIGTIRIQPQQNITDYTPTKHLSVLDLLWHLPRVSMSGWLTWLLACMQWVPQVHLWCDTCWLILSVTSPLLRKLTIFTQDTIQSQGMASSCKLEYFTIIGSIVFCGNIHWPKTCTNVQVMITYLIGALQSVKYN